MGYSLYQQYFVVAGAHYKLQKEYLRRREKQPIKGCLEKR